MKEEDVENYFGDSTDVFEDDKCLNYIFSKDDGIALIRIGEDSDGGVVQARLIDEDELKKLRQSNNLDL